MLDESLCKEVDTPANLVTAVSLDLELLENIGSDLRVLDSSDAALQLIFELLDGTFLVWPGLARPSKIQGVSDEIAKEEFDIPDQVAHHFLSRLSAAGPKSLPKLMSNSLACNYCILFLLASRLV